MSKYKLITISDEEIIKKANGEVTLASDYTINRGTDRNSIDFERNYTDVPGGLYSSSIFGKKFKCKCKVDTRHGKCPACKVTVLDGTNDYDLFGYYRLQSKVIFNISIKNFVVELSKLLPKFSSQYDISEKDILTNIWNRKVVITPVDIKTLTEKDYELYDFIYDEENNMYKLDSIPYESDDSSDNYYYYGVNGLDMLFQNYLPAEGNFDKLKTFIHGVIPISPIADRPMGKTPDGKLQVPLLTSYYSAVIDYNKKIEPLLKTDELADRLMLAYQLNRLIDMLNSSYSIVATSKESIVRYLSSMRLPKSGRAIITGDGSLDIDTIKVPRSMAYECIKSDLINKIEKNEINKNLADPMYIIKDARFLYDNPTPEVMKLFEAIIEGNEDYEETGSVAVINRAPTLHKLSVQAFKIKLWDENTIAMNQAVVKGFNADFDGDQMGIYFLTHDPQKTNAFLKMSPKNNWFFAKDKSAVYTPNDSMLLGLYYATRIRKSEDEVKEFFNLDDVKRAKEQKLISFDDQILFNGRISSYGRECVSEILGTQLENIISPLDEEGKPVIIPIRANNIGKIMAYLYNKDDRTSILSRLIDLSEYVVTIMGSSIATLGDLYKIDDNFPEIEEIMTSNLSEDEKIRRLHESLPKIVEKTVMNLKSTTFEEAWDSGAKPKINSIIETFSPQTLIKDGQLINFGCSIFTGLSEEASVHHSATNREILKQKAKLVPISGYFTRQFVDVMQDLLYKTDRLSTDKLGILVPKWMAVGRTDLNGNLIKENNSEELVRIKSSINNSSNIVCKDEIDYNFYRYENDTSIGFDMSTSLSENLTQSNLGLKHGGRTWVPISDKLIAQEDLTLESIGEKSITFRNNKGDYLTYLIPDNALMSSNLDNRVIKKGDTIYYLNKLIYLDYKLALTKALLGVISDKLKTEKIKVWDCYSLDSGNIQYKDKYYIIGSFRRKIEPDAIYYYPEGAWVNKGDRICSGVQNIKSLIKSGEDIGWVFYIYIKSVLDSLYGTDVMIKHKLPVSLESLELLFKCILVGDGSVNTSNIKNPRLISKQTYGYNKQAIKEHINKDMGDSLLLRLIMGENLDDYE